MQVRLSGARVAVFGFALALVFPAGDRTTARAAGGRGTGESSGEGEDGSGWTGHIVVAGETMEVFWNDGDTFRVTSGSLRTKKARLADYNTLESYGPVHRWGGWTPKELLALAKESGKVAAAGSWECHDAGEPGGYGRVLFSCPDLTRALVGKGHAHVFSVGRPADPALLALQAKAQASKLGMWAKGVPDVIVTSVHSVEEGKGYDRVVDTRTGAAVERKHERHYDTCEAVCAGPAGADSCMIYVPFEKRYRDKPPCLR